MHLRRTLFYPLSQYITHVRKSVSTMTEIDVLRYDADTPNPVSTRTASLIWLSEYVSGPASTSRLVYHPSGRSDHMVMKFK